MPGAQPIAQLVQRGVEAGPLPVELVHEHHAGQAQVGGHLPRLLGLDLDPVDRADHEYRQVGHPQRGRDVADEVGVARRVDEVDLVVAPLERCQRQRQGDAAALLLGVVVAHRRAVLDPSEAVDGAGAVQQRLGQACLARAAVTHECDVADLVGRIPLHQDPLCPRDIGAVRARLADPRRSHRGVSSASDPARGVLVVDAATAAPSSCVLATDAADSAIHPRDFSGRPLAARPRWSRRTYPGGRSERARGVSLIRGTQWRVPTRETRCSTDGGGAPSRMACDPSVPRSGARVSRPTT